MNNLIIEIILENESKLIIGSFFMSLEDLMKIYILKTVILYATQ